MDLPPPITPAVAQNTVLTRRAYWLVISLPTIIVPLLSQFGCILFTNVNDLKELNLSPLIRAVKKQDLPLFRELIKRGYDINRVYGDEFEPTPLHVADGASTEVITTTGMIPLYLAVLRKDSEMVNLLLDHGARVDAVTVENSPPSCCRTYWAQRNRNRLTPPRSSERLQVHIRRITT